VKFVTIKKRYGNNFFSSLSFVAVFGSGIRDKHPGSATLIAGSVAVPVPDVLR
jgi:hypothetical protein